MALTKIPSELSSTTGIVDNSNATAITIDSNENVGIGVSNPSDYYASWNNLVVGDTSGSAGMSIVTGTSNEGTIAFADGTSGDAQYKGYIQYNQSVDRLVIGVNGTEKMRIDSSGNVGVGTTSPTSISGYTALEINNATSGALLDLSQGDSMRGRLIATATTMSLETSGSIPIIFQPTGVERMRIDSSGNVQIGTGTPAYLVSTSDIAQLSVNRVGTSGAITNASRSAAFINVNGANGGSSIEFSTASANNTQPTERMRIDSSGNLLVGKTATALGTAGHTFGNDGYLYHTRSGDIMFLNRLNSDGTLISFLKNGANIGNISSYGASRLSIGSGDIGLVFAGDYNAIYPNDGGLNSQDNAVDLGLSSVRFDDIYATNGTIQTSDRNEKQDIAELSDAEQRVAVAAKGLLRKFRWKDSVAEKGDDARIHFGIIAQDLQAAFEAEGLDAGDYAMFISTTWTDEETNEEKTRMGVRYSELLAFIISAI